MVVPRLGDIIVLNKEFPGYPEGAELTFNGRVYMHIDEKL